MRVIENWTPEIAQNGVTCLSRGNTHHYPPGGFADVRHLPSPGHLSMLSGEKRNHNCVVSMGEVVVLRHFISTRTQLLRFQALETGEPSWFPSPVFS